VCTLDQPSDIKVRGSSAIPSVLNDTDFFIVDRANNSVLVTRDGGSSGIVADRVGNGTFGYVDGIDSDAQFKTPTSVAYDSLHEQLYIADGANMRVRRYSLVNLTVSTVAGNGNGKLRSADAYVAPVNSGGPATDSAINFPIGVAFLPTGAETQGDAYVSGVYENQIRKLTIGTPG
jgi:hypothetical protein